MGCFFFAVALHAEQAEPEYLSLQRRVYEVFRDHKDAVVQVFGSVDRKSQSDSPSEKNLLLVGTGFFISKEGHILTNASICYSADRIWIELNGVYHAATVVGHDLTTNLSILRVMDLPADMHYVSLPNTNDLPEVGTMGLAVSRQVGLPASPAMGMVTGQNIQFGNRMLPTTYLRADIPSQTGESGSPVFDLNGQLLGIMVASLPEIRSSFILPVKAIRRVRDDIIFSGEVHYAWFGLKATQLPSGNNTSRVVIQEIVPGSPALAVGIRQGDALVKIGDFAIHSDRDLREAVFFTPPNINVMMVVDRAGRRLELPMKVGLREVQEPTERQARENAARQAAIPGQEIQLAPVGITPSAQPRKP